MKSWLMFLFLFYISIPLLGESYSVKLLEGLTIIPINLNGYADKKNMELLGDYYLGYKSSGVKFKNVFGEEKEIIDYAFIFVRKKGVDYVLGKIEKYAVYDAMGAIIKQIDKTHPTYAQIMGISPKILKDPLGIVFVTKSKGYFGEPDAFCLLKVDVQRKTIVEDDPFEDMR